MICLFVCFVFFSHTTCDYGPYPLFYYNVKLLFVASVTPWVSALYSACSNFYLVMAHYWMLIPTCQHVCSSYKPHNKFPILPLPPLLADWPSYIKITQLEFFPHSTSYPTRDPQKYLPGHLSCSAPSLSYTQQNKKGGITTVPTGIKRILIEVIEMAKPALSGALWVHGGRPCLHKMQWRFSIAVDIPESIGGH